MLPGFGCRVSCFRSCSAVVDNFCPLLLPPPRLTARNLRGSTKKRGPSEVGRQPKASAATEQATNVDPED